MKLFSLETSRYSSPWERGGFGLFLRTIDPIRNRNLRSQAPKEGRGEGTVDEWKKGNTQFFIIIPLYSVTEDLFPFIFPWNYVIPTTITSLDPPPPLPFSPAVNKDWPQKQDSDKLDIKVSTFLVYDSIT